MILTIILILAAVVGFGLLTGSQITKEQENKVILVGSGINGQVLIQGK